MITRRLSVVGVLAGSLWLAGCNQKSGDTPGAEKTQSSAMALRSTGNAQWNALMAGSSAAGPTLKTSDKTDSIVLDVSFMGYSTSPVVNDQGSFLALSVPECGVDGQVGDPALPFKGYFVEIPAGVLPRLEMIDDVASTRSISARVFPHQSPAIDSVNTPPPFTLNSGTYAQNAFLPAQPAEIARVGYMRGHQVAFIKVYPVQYNPSQGVLRVHQRLQLRIGFSPATEAVSVRRASEISNPEYEEQM